MECLLFCITWLVLVTHFTNFVCVCCFVFKKNSETWCKLSVCDKLFGFRLAPVRLVNKSNHHPHLGLGAYQIWAFSFFSSSVNPKTYTKSWSSGYGIIIPQQFMNPRVYSLCNSPPPPFLFIHFCCFIIDTTCSLSCAMFAKCG